ncbi:MAG: sugar phosphate isomerase/epimerase family protein [Victivallales bacterium]
MKKGFSILWRDWDEVRRLLPAVAQAGFEGVEPVFSSEGIPANVKDAREFRKFCFDHGLSIPSLRGGAAFWADFSPADIADHTRILDAAKKSLDCLAEMGGKVLLLVPGRLSVNIPYFEHWRWAVEIGRELGDLAAERNLQIGLENVEARFPLSLRDWRDLLTEINHPNVGMYLDVGNVVWMDVGSPDDWLVNLKPFIRQIHFKDAKRGIVLRNLLAGDVDWPAVMRTIRVMNYDGWICVEPEWYKHAPAQICERLSKDMDCIFSME